MAGKASSTGSGQEASPDADRDVNDNGLDTPLGGSSVSPGGVASGVATLGPKTTLLGGEPTAETQVQGSRPSTTADTRENFTVDFGRVYRHERQRRP